MRGYSRALRVGGSEGEGRLGRSTQLPAFGVKEPQLCSLAALHKELAAEQQQRLQTINEWHDAQQEEHQEYGEADGSVRRVIPAQHNTFTCMRVDALLCKGMHRGV